jgi:hypothetical protein
MDITQKELTALCNDWSDARQAVLDDLLIKMAAPFIGRTFKQTKVFGSLKMGTQAEHQVVVTITGAQHAWEGDIKLVGTFTHPITGKVKETEVQVEDTSYLED